MRTGILLLVTDEYQKYADRFIQSARKYFMPGEDKMFFLLTDYRKNRKHPIVEVDLGLKDVMTIEIEHKPSPHITLLRYELFEKVFAWEDFIYSDAFVQNAAIRKFYKPIDYYFYFDIDTYFCATVHPEEVLSNLVAVQHCGFIGKPGTFEMKQTASTSYVTQAEAAGATYYGGGMQGGHKDVYMKACRTLKKMINADLAKGIIPVWHDESAWNRYLIDNPPTKVLTPSFHYPEESHGDYYRQLWADAGLTFEPKLKLINKYAK